MAEVRNIQVDKQDQETGYLELTAVVAEIVKIVKADQGYSLIGLRDFAGQEIVALIRGRVRPSRNDVGAVSVFMLSGQTKGNKVNYSGFYNPKDEIPPQYQGKRPPAPAESGGSGGSGRGGGGSAGSGDAEKTRSVVLSYAKDLACAGAIDIKQVPATALIFAAYVSTGKWPVKQVQHQPAPQPEEDREIPEMGQEQPGNFDDQYPQEQAEAGGGGTEFKGEGSLADTPF